MPPISFRHHGTPTKGLADSELPPCIGWRNSADHRLARAARSGDVAAFGAALRRFTAFARKVRHGDRCSDTCDVFLQPLWSLRAFEGSSRSQRLPQLLRLFAGTHAKPDRKTIARASRQILNCLDQPETESPDNPFAQLCWLTILTWGSNCLDDETLARLWLHTFQRALSSVTGDPDATDPMLTDDQHLLLHGELPFLTGLVFQEVRGSRLALRHGERRLREGLEAGTDRDGTPHSRLLDRFSLWLSPLCRAAIAGRRFDTPCWNRSSQRRFSKLILRSAALTRSTGEFALGNGVALAPASLLKVASSVAEFASAPPSRSFVETVANDVAALTENKTRSSRRTNRVKSRTAGQGRPKLRRRKRSDRPASQSDWARLACLRNNWDLGADACVIAYHEQLPRIDVTALGTAVISGVWALQSKIDGVPLTTDAAWDCVCWFSDGDADYVELQRTDPRGTVLRQALLSRTDHFLYFADNVRSSSDRTGRVEHSFELPLATAVNAKRDALTREWLLKSGPLKVRALPVSLEQNATIAADGDLAVSDDSIRFRQSTNGHALMSALFLDWSPARRRDAALWRQLTVAEDGRILSPSQAAGMHLRMGSHQWLFYRAHTPGCTARTVVGQHTANETLIGELNSDGDLAPLLIVEGGQAT